MTYTYHTELTEIAAQFVELMRSDSERSFDLRDFFRYAQFRLGREGDESAERIIGKRDFDELGNIPFEASQIGAQKAFGFGFGDGFLSLNIRL